MCIFFFCVSECVSVSVSMCESVSVSVSVRVCACVYVSVYVRERSPGELRGAFLHGTL